MFGPMHPTTILSFAQTLAKAIHALRGYPALVEYMNTLEETLPARDQESEPEPNPENKSGGGPRVSALRRRWLLLRDAASESASGALYWCAKAVQFAPELARRLSRLANEAKRLRRCDVCEARELLSRMMFSGERAVCESCIWGALKRANALRLPGEPVMTETFLCELLSLQRISHREIEGDRIDAATARDDKDAEIRHERLMSLGDVRDDTRGRWLVAIAPIAHRLGTFDEFMSRTSGSAVEEG